MKTYFKNIKSDKYSFSLLLLCVFHTFGFILFHIMHKAYQTWDSAGHIGMSFLMADRVKGISEGTTSIVDLIKTSDYYPPFIQFLGALVSLIFGYHEGLLVFFGLIFFLLAIVYLYRVVLLLTLDKRVALVSAIVFSLFPQVYDQSRVFHLDLPLIALLLMASYYYLVSNKLTSFKNSIIFFILFAFAQLTKWYAFVYLFIPGLVAAYNIVFKPILNERGESIKGKAFINIFIGLLIVVVIASPWYVLNLEKLLEYSSIFSTPEEDDPQSFLSIENLTYYISRVSTYQIFFIPSLLTLLGLGALFKKDKKQALVTFLWMLFPIALFTVVQNKNLRYVLPLTPIFAFLVSYCVYILGQKVKTYKGVVISFVLFLIFGYFFTSFNQVKPMSQILNPIGIVLAGPGFRDWYYNPGFYSYEPQYWPVKEVLYYIVEDANYPHDKGLGVTPLMDSENFSLASFEMLRREAQLKNVYLPVPYFQFKPFETVSDIEDYFNENAIQYVIVPDNPGPSGLRNYSVLVQLIEYFTTDQNLLFSPVRTFELPDKSEVTVYKRDENRRNTLVQTDRCINNAGAEDGIETIKLQKGRSYIFYTGHFAVNSFKRDFEPGVLYVVQMENFEHESSLDVYNLPHTGVSMCNRAGVGIDVSEEIRKPLIEKGHCAIDCKKVIHIKWNIGSEDFQIREYNRGDF